MKIYIGNLKENYYYGVYNLLKMIYPDIEVLKDENNSDISYNFEIDENEVCVIRNNERFVENVVENNIPLTLKRIIYKAENKKLPFGIMTGIRPSKTVFEYSENQIETLEKIYFLNPQKARVSYECAMKEKELSESLGRKTVSLYINIPFCPTRCSYCSFTMSNVKTSKKLVDSYFEALMKDLEYTSLLFKKLGLGVYSVYIGGGTPTILDENQLDRLTKAVACLFDGFCEFTVEAGRPDTINLEKMEILYKNKVTRVSINPQTLNQKTLDKIGRKHTVEQFYKAYEYAQKAGFENINTDLIAGLQDESVEDFKNTFEKILSLSPHSLTVHTLCKKRTSYMENDVTYDDNIIGEMLDYAYMRLKNIYRPYYLYRQKNAVGSYENVGFVRDENICAYNLIMMQEIGSVVSVGAGGTSKLIDYESKIPFSKLRTDKQAHTYIENIDEILKKKKNFLETGKDKI